MSDYGSTPPPPPPPPGGGYAVDHPKGTTILVLGILSIVCFQPLGIAAWLMGNGALKEIDAAPGRYSNRQIVQIGRILGIVGTVLLIIGIIGFILWIVLVIGLASSSSGM